MKRSGPSIRHRATGIMEVMMQKYHIWLSVLAAVFLILLTMGCSIAVTDEGMPVNAREVSDSSLAEKLIRFHVIANSGSDSDQSIKLAVRDAVVEYLQPILSDITDTGEARSIIRANLANITDIADQVLSNAGVSYRSRAELAFSEFPLKLYGDIALPPGEYEALRIILGEGQGQNWWCLMFPPLCFVDSSCGIVSEDSKEALQALLTEDEYDSILREETQWQPRFLLLEWLRQLFS